jgi:hypothetical protein
MPRPYSRRDQRIEDAGQALEDEIIWLRERYEGDWHIEQIDADEAWSPERDKYQGESTWGYERDNTSPGK